MQPTAAGVAKAGSLLRPYVVRTPLLESPLLNHQLQTRVLLKAECLQRTGSFKYRGALHRLLCLQPEEAKRGVVAFSSGNFGQALAAASTLLGIRCCIVSPHDAPEIKLQRIQRYGADLVLSQPEGQNREVAASQKAQEIADSQGMTLLHPFEDVDVVHGQGTVGLELLEQSNAIGTSHDGNQFVETSNQVPSLGTIVVPCGGGGLTAGICLAVEEHGMQSTVKVMTVEPKGYDDHASSFLHQKRMTLAELYPVPLEDRSVSCDALMAGAPGHTTWGINHSRLSAALASTGDDSVARAMRLAFEHFRLVLEPSGALSLAAVLDGQVDIEDGKAIVVVASGGNTDLTTFANLMGCGNKNI